MCSTVGGSEDDESRQLAREVLHRRRRPMRTRLRVLVPMVFPTRLSITAASRCWWSCAPGIWPVVKHRDLPWLHIWFIPSIRRSPHETLIRGDDFREARAAGTAHEEQRRNRRAKHSLRKGFNELQTISDMFVPLTANQVTFYLRQTTGHLLIFSSIAVEGSIRHHGNYNRYRHHQLYLKTSIYRGQRPSSGYWRLSIKSSKLSKPIFQWYALVGVQ
jgi:hypothetical protein